jgi:hypothetical protein
LLELRVGDADIGDTVRIDDSRPVTIAGRATGRSDFKKIELVHNGTVLAGASSRAAGGHFDAELKFELKAEASGWVALRIPSRAVGVDPQPSTQDPARTNGEIVNELGEVLFAHTSPIYLDFAGRPVFLPDAARALIADLETAMREIVNHGRFADDAQRAEVLAIYRESAEGLRRKLDR